MNEQYLLDEFEAGEIAYPYVSHMDTAAGIEFFIRHGHQVAFDDGDYDLFLKAFPHFFEYRDHIPAFLERFVK